MDLQMPIPVLLGDFEEGLRFGDAGVVDQDVDFPELREGRGNEGLNLSRRAHIDSCDALAGRSP